MLRSIGGISEAAANRIAAHYTCAKRLIDALNDKSLPVQQRELLLADKISNQGGKSSRGNPKLARRIFRLFTCEEENDLIVSDSDDD